MPRAALHHHDGIVTLQASARLDAAADLPTRIVMMKWGVNDTAEGPMTVGLKTLQASALWEGIGFGEVAIDFNHNTVPGHPSYQGEPAPIAAMATPRVIEGEGLVFDNIRWTAEGRAHREHYADLSPAIKLAEDGEVIFVHSGALARNGAVPGLHLCSALPADLAARLRTLSATQPTIPTTMQDLLKKLLKLPADATEADITKALEAAISAAETPVENVEEIKAMNANLTKAINLVRAELKGEITTLNARFDARERELVIEQAASTGRQIPKEWLPDEKGEGGLPIAQLRTLSASLPITIPVERRTPTNIVTLNANPDGLTAEDREVAKQLGISEDRMKKGA